MDPHEIRMEVIYDDCNPLIPCDCLFIKCNTFSRKTFKNIIDLSCKIQLISPSFVQKKKNDEILMNRFPH